METLTEILENRCRLLSDRTFLIADDATLTYGAFGETTARLANVLADAGVGRGDRVGLYLPSKAMMAVAFWACQRLGAVPAPVSAMFRHDELRKIVAQTDMVAMIADDATWPYFSEIRDEFEGLLHVFVAGGCDADAAVRDLDALMAAATTHFENASPDPGDMSALFFSSGTTGTPKGIAQSHFSTVSALRDMMVSHRARFAAETYVSAVPLFTNFGLTVTLNLAFYAGGTIVQHERWDTARILDAIGTHRGTYFGGTPTMYVYMVNDFDASAHDLSSLSVCTTGGAPVPQPVIRRFEALSGARVTQVYGSTETCGQNVMEPTAGIRKPGSAGLPVGSSRILIVDDDGKPVEVAERGEVVIGGDCVALGYFRDDAATAAAFSPDGWKSGDIGYLDEDGYLYIVDRKKDVIIAGGHNIYPLEIESLLYRHAGVAMCAVVGIADESKGEIPVAAIVRAAGADLDEAAVIAYCRENLAAYKVPRQVHFIDRLPVEAAKVRKRELSAAIAEGRIGDFRD